MKYKIVFLIIICVCSNLFSQSQKLEMRGADISFLEQQENCGINFFKNGENTPVLQILSEAGVNWIRLRLWHTPKDNWNNLEHTLKNAQKIKAAGFRFLLDIHYSDSWADPSKQNIPKDWEKYNFKELCSAFEKYTADITEKFNASGCTPDMIQIGNEITNGMLWQYGKLSGNQGFKNFTTLLKKAAAVIRKNCPNTKIMLHIDKGDNNAVSEWFFNIMKTYDVDYDVIGLSYYSYWNGKNLDNVGKNISRLKKHFGKDVCIAETSYIWTLKWNDNCTNIVGMPEQLIDKYPASAQGQKNYLNDLCAVVAASGGCGVFWWEPTAVSAPGFPSALENTTWFDFNCNYNGTGDVFFNFVGNK